MRNSTPTSVSSSSPSPDPCPGGEVVVSWDNPGDRRTNGDWYALFPANYTDLLADPIDWRYMYSLDKVVVNEVDESEYHLVHTYTATMPNTVEPGDYIMFIFMDDGYDIFAQVPFKVKPWAECGVRDASCSSDTTCSGHGKCAQSACQCDDGFSFWDCSRGCSSAPVTLAVMTGKIDTGVYNNKQTCTWDDRANRRVHRDRAQHRVDPPRPGRFGAHRNDDRGGGRATGAAATPMPTAAPARTVGPELSAGYRVHNDITQSAGASTLTITTEQADSRAALRRRHQRGAGPHRELRGAARPAPADGGEIAGIVIGSLAAAILLVVGAVLLTQWFQKRSRSAPPPPRRRPTRRCARLDRRAGGRRDSGRKAHVGRHRHDSARRARRRCRWRSSAAALRVCSRRRAACAARWRRS
jgi:hypothetical protein